MFEAPVYLLPSILSQTHTECMDADLDSRLGCQSGASEPELGFSGAA